MTYSNELLEAIGEWQNGWGEDAQRRITVTSHLRGAVASAGLPEVAQRADGVCYRKRFLVPNNPQNGGDLKPLILNGRIDEGIASWTRDLSYAKNFKEMTRANNISAVFAHRPTAKEVVLNIEALWEDPDFGKAIKAYADGHGRYALALENFRALQSEIILDAPLLIQEVEAFCDRASDFDHLCKLAKLTTEDQRDEFWRLMVKADTFPGDAQWLDREQSQRALTNLRKKFDELHGPKK